MTPIRIRSICALLILISIAAGLMPIATPAATREPVRGKHAMVASQHPLASQIGVEIMKKGGNAIDAAIAVGIALAVVYPEAGNLGGGGFMLIRRKDGTTKAIDYREMAPAAASRDMYVDKNGELIRGEGPVGGGECPIEVGGRGAGDLGDDCLGRGVDDLERLASGAGNPFAVDQQENGGAFRRVGVLVLQQEVQAARPRIASATFSAIM